LEPLLKVRGLLLSEFPVLPPEALPREKPWKGEPTFPPLPLEMAPSIGRATVWLPDERVVNELLSDDRLLEPPNDFPLNVAPLSPLPLPNERVDRSVFGIWTDWLLRELKLRDESLLGVTLRDDEEPLLPLLPLLLLLDERPPWFDRSFLSSLSRAAAKLAVRKIDRSPTVATH
jgi:hypothetical protein